jgi:hypothetical protein
MSAMIIQCLFFSVSASCRPIVPPSDAGISSPVSALPGYSGCAASAPDYYQRSAAFGGFPGGGTEYCGPVAVSNSLMWLRNHGYPSLVASSGNSFRDQHTLIALLGSSDFMNTRKNGSSVEDLCRGAHKYLAMHGLGGRIKAQGMYYASKEFRDDKKIPDFDEIKAFTTGARAVWLNIGWYTYDSLSNRYEKTGGHWVTSVGYGFDGENFNDNALIVHDPDTKGPANDYLKTEVISSGMIANESEIPPIGAPGYRRFREGKNRFGIICGAVFLSLDTPPSQQMAFGLR